MRAQDLDSFDPERIFSVVIASVVVVALLCGWRTFRNIDLGRVFVSVVVLAIKNSVGSRCRNSTHRLQSSSFFVVHI